MVTLNLSVITKGDVGLLFVASEGVEIAVGPFLTSFALLLNTLGVVTTLTFFLSLLLLTKLPLSFFLILVPRGAAGLMKTGVGKDEGEGGFGKFVGSDSGGDGAFGGGMSGV